MSSEWIEWKGGACPVPIGTKVEVRHRSGGVFLDRAGVKDSFARDWQHTGMMGDILAYRVIDEDKPAALATDGWIEWKGGDCPCGPGAIVGWQTRAMPGDTIFWGPREADILDWRHTGGGDDIVAFRVVGQVKLDSDAPERDPHGLAPNAPGAKLDAGKVRLHLVLGSFARALHEVGRVGTYGAEKYSDNGWLSVPKGEERYTDAMLRHYVKEQCGELVDPDTGIAHAAHAAWNALARLELAIRRMEAP